MSREIRCCGAPEQPPRLVPRGDFVLLVTLDNFSRLPGSSNSLCRFIILESTVVPWFSSMFSAKNLCRISLPILHKRLITEGRPARPPAQGGVVSG